MKRIVMTIIITIQDTEEVGGTVVVMEGAIDVHQMMRVDMTMITSVHIRKEVQTLIVIFQVCYRFTLIAILIG